MKKEQIFTIHRFVLMAVMLGMVACFQSCATFDKGVANPHHLTSSNISNLDGTYNNDFIGSDSLEGYFTHRDNFLSEIDRKLFRDTLYLFFDSTKTYQFELKVIDASKIRVSYLENNLVMRVRDIEGKLKSDGYFYLKNKNVGCVMIPYLFGAINIHRMRITVDQNGDLVVDVAHHNSGAILLIVGWANWKHRNIYSTIDSKIEN